jgi:hypothetical protein
MPALATVSAGLIPLDSPGTYLGWGWFNISVGNLIVVVLMLAAFVTALFARFPGSRR